MQYLTTKEVDSVGLMESLHLRPSVVQDSASTAPSKVQLTDLSDLADRAANSGDEIRPEAVERAKALLSDPNWLNDDALEGLAEKLLSTEDFTG
jgi:hypothetical protein